MPAPVASILIPVFNGETYLPECLDSILAQEFADFEVLIGDDGSTDGSLDLIRSYAERDRRIRWWRNPRNLGPAGNFNFCLKEAAGTYIKYVLQDDKLLVPSALGRLVELMDQDSSVALAASASHVIDERSKVTEIRNRFGRSGTRDGKRVIAQCLAHNTNLIGEPSLTLFRKSQAGRGFDAGLKQLLDLEMWFHLLEQGRFAYLAEPLCAFRQHPRQQSEVNRLSGAAANDHLALMEAYYARPWMKDVATPRMIFAQMYRLRKSYGRQAGPLLAEMSKSLDPSRYAAFWLQYKLTRPLRVFRQWLERRGHVLEHPEADRF